MEIIREKLPILNILLHCFPHPSTLGYSIIVRLLAFGLSLFGEHCHSANGLLGPWPDDTALLDQVKHGGYLTRKAQILVPSSASVYIAIEVFPIVLGIG